MIVNRHSKIGLFGNRKPNNTKGLFLFDFNTQEKKYLTDFPEWEPQNISIDGKRIAITRTSSNTRAYRTDLVITDHENETVLLNTDNYCIYDVEFNAKGNKIIIVASKKKPFCYDLSLQQITAELPKQIRTYKGDLDPENDTFLAPCENTKDTCYLFNFATGKTESIKFGTKAMIGRIKFSVDFTFIYLITETNVLYCFDRDYKIKWYKDFNYLGKDGGRINSSDIFQTENGQLLALYASSTESNSWGAEYVVDATNGEIVNQIEAYQFRGGFSSDFFENKVLLYTHNTIDLITGKVSENPVI
ncbi:hypothetical protein ACHRV5_05870 [Flavobacterium sp. FlaQc-52]|uniref:hypothetical protein n=1 Tax=Flavobacterium sp. FlaQc-52 TaxID=3374185 RepID=UPI0037581A20